MRAIGLRTLLAAGAIFWATALPASDVDHYSGKEADTLEEAVSNLREYNARVADLLDKDELTGDDLAKVHELSYTIENALARIRTELGTMADTLETVHLGSERGEKETVRDNGRVFLERSRTLIGE